MKDAVAKFNEMSLAYTYDNNGWAFTNYFEGTNRISELEVRGTLNETVAIEELRDEIYMITWEDEEMGYITQMIDLPNKKMIASIPIEGKLEIWPATITDFVKGRI